MLKFDRDNNTLNVVMSKDLYDVICEDVQSDVEIGIADVVCGNNVAVATYNLVQMCDNARVPDHMVWMAEDIVRDEIHMYLRDAKEQTK